ncbi:MAG: hypothetical protein ABL911_03810 [Gallionella sp.]
MSSRAERRRQERGIPRHARRGEDSRTSPVVSPIARDAVSTWQELASGQGLKMGFLDERKNMTGFVLTGEYASERNEMTKRLAV